MDRTTQFAVIAAEEAVRNAGIQITPDNAERIGVMDSTAVTLCRENKLPIRVFKLTDRGTHQAVGLVTDCEYFLFRLADALGKSEYGAYLRRSLGEAQGR